MSYIFKSLSYSVISLVLLLSVNAYAKEVAKPWQLKTQTGEVVSLDQYKNKPVILHFWATWCPYCKKIQPTLVELQKEISSRRC